MSDRIAVLIVGAGPTGLALGCDLARRGVPFRIIDKNPEYFAGSRGKGLQPRTLEVMDDFGIVDRILANGRFHVPFRAYENGKVVGDRDIHEGRHPTPDTPYASSMIIPQWRVEETLRGLLEQLGHRVELSTELTSFTQNDQEVLATLNDRQVSAQYMIGADGGRSFVRKELDVSFEGETWTTERMLVGDVEVEGLDRDHWHSWQHPEKGWLGLCPLPSTNSFQLQAQIAPDYEAEPSLQHFQEVVDERTGGMQIRLHNATWLSLFRANIRMVNRYRVGRVFLAGDAAHVHSPAGGQGMNTGIQDAYNLGWKLGHVLKGGRATLLDTYEEERLPVAANMLGITTRLHRAMLSQENKDIRRGPETLQLGINYRGSSLSSDQRTDRGPVEAGDRAPDAPCHDSAGAVVRLFDVFRGPQFTLLHFEGERIRAGKQQVLLDSGGHARRAYGVADGTHFLIRPDGYIAAIASDLASIETRFSEFLS